MRRRLGLLSLSLILANSHAQATESCSSHLSAFAPRKAFSQFGDRRNSRISLYRPYVRLLEQAIATLKADSDFDLEIQLRTELVDQTETLEPTLARRRRQSWKRSAELSDSSPSRFISALVELDQKARLHMIRWPLVVVPKDKAGGQIRHEIQLGLYLDPLGVTSGFQNDDLAIVMNVYRHFTFEIENGLELVDVISLKAKFPLWMEEFRRSFRGSGASLEMTPGPNSLDDSFLGNAITETRVLRVRGASSPEETTRALAFALMKIAQFLKSQPALGSFLAYEVKKD